MPREYDVLIIDDDPEILHLLQDSFADQQWTIRTADGIAAARIELERNSFRVVLSDHNLLDGCGVDFLAELPASGARSVPILMTGMLDFNIATEAINRGKVYRFVTKPLDLMALSQTIRRALDQFSALREQERLTCEIVQTNVRLRQEADVTERSLQSAAERLRSEEQRTEAQKRQIESLYSEIQQAYLHTVTSLTMAIEAKDRYTRGHSVRVFYYCSLIADVLGLSSASRVNLRFAAVLHDLGKIGIPDSVLHKRGRLTPDEFQIMATHPDLTVSILQPLPFLETVRTIIREHHERFDGKGYPEGLASDSISLEGRILAVADAYDAMRTDRAYRQALTAENALNELKSESGRQFCPLCVGALALALKSKGEFGAEDMPEDSIISEWEEEYMKIRPAAELTPITTAMN